MRAVREEEGSILVFLPGQGEIRRVATLIEERGLPPNVALAPLYGALDRAEQDRAIARPPAGRRKIVLATSIAETSLTIEGVRVVIDSGLSRVPRFEPGLGLTRLETIRASRANVEQRRGRAGRVEPGVCYRLWEEAATGALPAFAEPEILAADLSGLALDLAHWGVSDPAKLAFLDPPPAAAWAEALALCKALGALDEDGRLTQKGAAMRSLPVAPRLASMIIEAGERARPCARRGSRRCSRSAASAATIPIFRIALSVLRARARRGRATQGAWPIALRSPPKPLTLTRSPLAGRGDPLRSPTARSSRSPSPTASPRRAARAPSPWRMAVRRRCRRSTRCHAKPFSPWPKSPDAPAPRASSRRRRSRSPRSKRSPQAASRRARRRGSSPRAARLRRRRFKKLGAIRLSEQNLAIEPDLASAQLLAQGVATLGVARLPWSKAQSQLRDRVAFLRAAEGDEWPDLSDAALAEAAADWLAPHILGRTSLSAIETGDLDAALAALLPYALRRRLDEEAPAFFETPAGSSIALDYAAANGPLLSVRVQELFGLARHPTLAKGRVPVTLELLSPAHRPIQTTRDLPGFWKGSWNEVKKEMKGRYPRHVWPDDPASALPTKRAKPRG